ncbi:MAG: PIG-L deacetylase family protein [Candidatus Dojkabacteria bacterium]
MEDSYQDIFSDKQRILVLLAHPDDAEIICGGLIARLISDGKKVRTVIATNGDKGMHEAHYTNEEFKKIRLNSQKEAGKELGLKEDEIFNLGFPDGQVEESYENIGKIVYHLREFQPELVITHNPFELINDFSEDVRWINHRDHRKFSQMVFDATYPYCRDNGFYPEQIEQGLKPCYVSEFLLSDSYMRYNPLGFEVSDFLDKKRVALTHHMDGGVLSNEEVEGFMEEIQRDGGNFEVLGYQKIE